MAFTPVLENLYSFTNKKLSDNTPVVTNNLGRAVVKGEIVYLGGFFGEVIEQDGIANAATGKINIDFQRIISSKQIEVTDTFTAGNELWFVSGGSGAAGKLVDADPGTGTRVAVGIITGEQGTGGAQTAVEFRPYVQKQAAVSAVAALQAEPKTLVVKITADASTALPVAGLSEGDEIIGMSVICTAANANGTLVLEDGAGDDITDGVICAVDKVVTYAGTIDDAKSTLPATGAAIISVGGTAAATRGIVVISYIPA